MKRPFLLSVAGMAIVLSIHSAPAGQSALLKQTTNTSTPEPMSQAELTELGDPLFSLLLKDRPQEIQLDEIEKAILGPSGTRHLFVVSERLQSPARGELRRAVIMYSGTNAGIRLDPNVALSVPFDDQQFKAGLVEAWGWDDQRSRYNYYKLDGQPATWKFRATSVDADELTDDARRGTCLACHINGAPIMKELPIPWNNWHSFRNAVGHLSPGNASGWPVAQTPRFRDLRGAEDLEVTFVLPSIRQFNGRRLTAAARAPMAQPAAPGNVQEVIDGLRTLRPLFRTTEYNITSAEQRSGLHPLPQPGKGPPIPVKVRDTFFVNANLLAGGGITQYEGLGIPEAREFAAMLQLQPAEYRAVVTKFNTQLGSAAGDAHFAWFVPEPSHVDNHAVDLLIRRGVITKEFAAAVLAIDVETPVFSKPREDLLRLVPGRFQFRSLNAGDVPAAHPDELTKEVIKRLEALNPAVGSSEHEFLSLLRSASPIDGLKSKVAAYLNRTRTRLANTQQRRAEIDRLYGVMLQRRRDAAAAIPPLVESPMLFPTGTTPP